MAAGHRKDDWEKPRSKAEHFTNEEKAKIRANFSAGKTVTETARELMASSRTIEHHFSALRAEGLSHGGMPENPRKPANYTARLYKPNFDI